MTTQFKLPDLGEGVHEGQIVKLLVAEGDEVREDQPLMEVETDKAAVEIPSPVAGVVTKWHVAEQQVVNVGDVMVTFNDGERAPATTEMKPDVPPVRAVVPPAAPGTARRTAVRRKPASPAVRSLARKLGVTLESVNGTGPGGRVTRTDVQQAAEAPVEPAPAAAPRSAPAPPSLSVPGPTSAISVARPGAPVPIVNVPEGIADTDQHGPIVRQRLTRTRLTIAETMSRSWTNIPHVTDTDEADVTQLDLLRKQANAASDPAEKLTLLPFIVRAVALALRRHPIFNASYDDAAGEIIYKRYINIAIGVQTERGLIAPVLRNADQMTVPHIGAATRILSENARASAFEVNDLRGGTFTISNAGAFGGSRFSTPIINPPQVAVIALGRTRLRPWVVDDAIVPRLIMPLSFSFDHRIIDGAEEIAFQQDLVASLENPVRLM